MCSLPGSFHTNRMKQQVLVEEQNLMHLLLSLGHPLSYAHGLGAHKMHGLGAHKMHERKKNLDQKPLVCLSRCCMAAPTMWCGSREIFTSTSCTFLTRSKQPWWVAEPDAL